MPLGHRRSIGVEPHYEAPYYLWVPRRLSAVERRRVRDVWQVDPDSIYVPMPATAGTVVMSTTSSASV
jgi:hypothetical protein